MFNENDYSEVQGMISGFVGQLAKEYDNAYFLDTSKRQEFPAAFWAQLAEGGYFGLTADEKFGGSGFGSADLVTLLHSLAKSGMASYALLNQLVGVDILSRHGSEEQKKRLLPDWIAGKRCAYANLEATEGKSLFDFAMTATRDGDGYILEGTKRYAVGADAVGQLIVAARTQPLNPDHPSLGISLFVVDADADGVTARPAEINVRVVDRVERTSVTGDVFFAVEFDKVNVSKAQLIGVENEAGSLIEAIAGRMMLMLSAIAIGWGDRILAQSVDYANQRIIYEEPIGSYQALQHPMVRARTDVEMARLLVERAVTAGDEGCGDDEMLIYCGVAKQMATEAAYAACDIGLQTHGGSGFNRDVGIITLWPLILMSRIVPLSNDTILEHFAEEVMGMPTA